MAELEAILSSLGMGQYYLTFANAGFDTWRTLLDITEDDLDSLAVQRGHRRRLQQEIAYTLTTGAAAEDAQRSKRRNKSTTESPPNAHSGRKRQYIRHPKPDPNAPQRPLSAYVLFSNMIRDELQDNVLSFAEKSKIVGDRWQSMPESAKQHWRQKATGPWEKYKADQTNYLSTDAHRGYQLYLADFNASKPSKKQKGSAADSTVPVDGAASHVPLKHSLSSDIRASSAIRPLAPASSQGTSKPSNVSSPQSSKSDWRKGPVAQRQEKSSTASAQGKGPQWYSHACESCKKKKVKCNGGVPTCERCRKTHVVCHYAGGIRDREKRLVEEVYEKLGVWEDSIRRIKPQLDSEGQAEINRLLTLPPQTARPRKGSSDQASGSSGSDGGESDASNVGSMGSTDHLNEQSFAPDDAGDGRIDAFLGQTATDNWVERLKDNLHISETEERNNKAHESKQADTYSRQPQGKHISNSAGINSTGGGTSMFGERFEPYELPYKSTADSFVSAYFTTVHPSFPIISRLEFLRNYEKFFAFPRTDQPSSSTFVPMLHLILAIGAVHTYVTQASWAKDERFRLLSFAKAKATVLDASVLQATAYEQVQLCGLGGLYLLITYEVNRAWNISGLGVRCAQALGLHLTNTTPNMAESQRNLRLAIWFSILSLERTIAVITGRPSMVQVLDCSVTLPEDGLVDPDKDLQGPNSRTDSDPWRPIERTNLSHADGQTWHHIATAGVAVDPTFFIQHAQLSTLADEVLSRLYSPSIRHIKWSELQSTIRELDQKLCDWNSDLATPFHADPTRQRPEREASRIAIGMLYHSARMIINRPCLCRLDDRISKQSANSDSINNESAARCVDSARGILALLPAPPDLALIYQGPLWWMGFHHIKRATTILIHEITFFSAHTSAKMEDVMADAKKAINWLHAIGISSSPAYSSWITLSQLLKRAAQRFGGDVSDAVVAEGEHPALGLTEHAVAQGQEHLLPGSMLGVDVSEFQLGLGGDPGAENVFGDLNFGMWDQFGMDQGTIFPAMDDMDDMMEDGEGEGEGDGDRKGGG